MAKAPRTVALARFGLNVRQRREFLTFTQEKLAEQAELDPSYISGIERGVRNPSLLSIVRVAKALDTTASELFAGVDQ